MGLSPAPILLPARAHGFARGATGRKSNRAARLSHAINVRADVRVCNRSKEGAIPRNVGCVSVHVHGPGELQPIVVVGASVNTRPTKAKPPHGCNRARASITPKKELQQ